MWLFLLFQLLRQTNSLTFSVSVPVFIFFCVLMKSEGGQLTVEREVCWRRNPLIYSNHHKVPCNNRKECLCTTWSFRIKYIMPTLPTPCISPLHHLLKQKHISSAHQNVIVNSTPVKLINLFLQTYNQTLHYRSHCALHVKNI